MAKRFSGPGQPYEGLVRLDKEGRSKAQWNGQVRFIAEHLMDPVRWTKPRMVFVNSMSDLFHENLPFEHIAAIFGVMASAPRHTFQVLTKRPERARSFFEWAANCDSGLSGTHGLLHCISAALAAEVALGEDEILHTTHCADPCGPWPLPNVWLGVSVEDQESADARIPALLQCPAAVRWVSYEPAIGPVDFDAIQCPDEGPGLRFSALQRAHDDRFGSSDVTLDWIVVGGESGPGARPFDVVWARSVIEQCAQAGVACFVKQLGALPVRAGASVLVKSEDGSYGEITDRKGGKMAEWPTDLRVRQWPGGVR